MTAPKQDSDWRPLVRALAVASGLGFPLAVLVSSGALAGHYLDERFDGDGTWTLLGIALGVLTSALNGWRVLSRFSLDETDNPPDAGQSEEEDE